LSTFFDILKLLVELPLGRYTHPIAEALVQAIVYLVNGISILIFLGLAPKYDQMGAVAPMPGIMRLFCGISSRNLSEFALRQASSTASTSDTLPTTPRSTG